MLFPVTLLPLVALVITDTQVQMTDNAITVDVALSEPMVAERVKGMTGPQRMYVFVPNATSAHRTYTSLRGKIVAHERSRYTKLEIPTTPGGRCYEPVLVENIPTGVRLRATCGDAEVVVAPAIVHERPIAIPVAKEPMALPPRTKTQAQLLREALAPIAPETPVEVIRPAEVPVRTEILAAKPAAESKPVQAAQVAPATAVVAQAQPIGSPTAAVAQVAVVAQPTPAVAPIPMATPAPVPPTPVQEVKPAIPGTTGGASLLFAVLVIGGLGAAAYFFSRRRNHGGRMIKILETASIGPKRSLVVANIGGRTLILGVSEAGVTLLDTTAVAPVPARLPAVEPEPSLAENSVPDSERMLALRNKLMAALTGGQGSRKIAETEDIPSPGEPVEKSEQGILGRIFAKSSSEAARREHDFKDILEDSYEDQELRRRLAMGVGGRVA